MTLARYRRLHARRLVLHRPCQKRREPGSADASLQQPYASDETDRHRERNPRTPVGVKVYGTDLGEMEKIARQIEAVLRNVPGTSSAYAERVIGGYFLDIVPDRTALGRCGLSIGDVQDVIAMALGAEVITSTVEGRERRRHPLSTRAAE